LYQLSTANRLALIAQKTFYFAREDLSRHWISFQDGLSLISEEFVILLIFF